MSKKNRTPKFLVLACAFAMLVGSFAFFTDRVSESTTATAGNIDLEFVDDSLASESTGDQVQATDKVWDGSLVVENGILNPGDTIDMDYTVKNTGSKSMDVRQQLVLTSTAPLTASPADAPNTVEEYRLTIGGQEITPTAGSYVDDNGTADDGSDDKTLYTLTYELAEIILDGSVEKDAATPATEQSYEIALVFDLDAKNAFFDSGVTVDYNAMAKQHRNTEDVAWEDWANLTTAYEQVQATATP